MTIYFFNMITFVVDSRYVQDLEDDFVMNEDLTLYEFIGKDPVKAFYLGYNINDWFEKIDKKQRYLYSKQARHNKDDLEKYQSQIMFWTKKFSGEEEVDMFDLSEFIFNNIFFDKETEESDRIKLAFFLGNAIRSNKKDDEES